MPILAELGFRYASSIFPIRHDLYGIPDAPRFPYRPTDAVFKRPTRENLPWFQTGTHGVTRYRKYK